MEKGIKNINIRFILLEAAALIGLVVLIVCISPRAVRDDADLAELSEAVFSAIKDENGFSQSDAMGLRKYYGLDANEYEDMMLYLPASNMDAAELLIVVMQNESQAEELETAIHERLEQQKKVFESYGVEQMGILNRAVVCIRGRYALFAVCADADIAKEAFLRVIEGKGE